jgi:hypothetical protein
LVKEAESLKASPPDAVQLVAHAVDQVREAFGEYKAGDAVPTIVHLAMDRNIQPQGGMLYRATMLDGRVNTDPEQLERMGYAVKDGHLVTVQDVPVSQAYTAIEYWGGERQHRRWHMSQPVSVEPSRNGNPFFMDENMIAFGAKWKDSTKIEEGLLELHELLSQGVDRTRCIGIPVAIELVVQ